MDSRGEYFQKLYDDLIQQFKGKPNITTFQKAIARQLDELYAFFYELRIMRWLQNAEGAQLDGIGNIVDLSRTEALIWSNLAGQAVPMDDELYRLYLWFKIFLNTSEGTYADIVRTLKMFWPKTPIYYSEHVEVPATMFFTTEPLPIWETDFRILQIVTRVKAAGVALHFIIPTQELEEVAVYHATAPSVFLRQYIVCDAPNLSGEVGAFHATGASLFTREHIVVDNPELSATVPVYGAVGAYQTIKEAHIE